MTVLNSKNYKNLLLKIMKNIRLYEVESLYLSEKDTHEYPTVSDVKETDMVHYLMNNASLFEFVDLGLHSGLKWATCNVGATKPEEYGLYFAWGETQGYTGIIDEKQFSWADYKWSADASGTTMTKYNAIDGLTTLESADDAATAAYSGCRMPTKEECDELTANTTSAWTTVNGVSGMMLTSKVNGNSIFVPATGVCGYGSLLSVGQFGCLWSSSLENEDSQSASLLLFNSEGLVVNDGNRYVGFNVRPVRS